MPSRRMGARWSTQCRHTGSAFCIPHWKGFVPRAAVWEARGAQAGMAVAGSGTYGKAVGRAVDALGRRELEALQEIAARGRELEGGPPGELSHLRAFLEGASEEWLEAAPAAAARIHFTGRIEHDDLSGLLPVCEAQVMPSTFPQAFGIVAAEAAARGALALSAGHSGMAEVIATLAPALPEELRPLLSFEIGPRAVEEIATKLVAWLTLDHAEREPARLVLAKEAARHYSWEKVAKGVIAAALGRLNELQSPAVSAQNSKSKYLA